MHVPIRVDYGVRALVDLAQYANASLVPAAAIAKRQGIPEPYLERLLNTLSKNGIIRSHTGPQGGHQLAVEPSRISLGMVMNIFDGTDTLLGCLDNPGVCVQVDCCTQRDVWRSVDKAIQDILNSTSIADLVAKMNTPKEKVTA
ncbi:MAG: Rrf2 family transcriptional regulator [Dehalococcoidia bacterium]|nr:Rrf2 family transcriptional regulator [Dehalococcoidia bacterium]